jgi:hypothetical protein
MTKRVLASWDSITRIRSGRVQVPGVRTRIEYDHRHAGERIRFYDYMDAATLLADFWIEVETVMKERSESDD